MLMGRSDTYYTVEEAEQVLGLIKGDEKELVWYDSGHGLPMESVSTRTVEWFQRYLK